MKNITRSKTAAHFVCWDAQKTRARFNGVMRSSDMAENKAGKHVRFSFNTTEEHLEIIRIID